MMDPLSITTSVLTLSGVCVTTARRLCDLKTRFDLASITLTAILSETTVVSASLGQIQTAMLQCSTSFVDQLAQNPVLLGAFDTALIGCSMVFLALQEEVDKLELAFFKAGAGQDQATLNIGFKHKIHLLWKENTMKELLSQIRGQQTSMTLLLQALNITSMTDLHTLMKDNSRHLELLAQSTEHLRKSYPSIRAPASVFDATGDDGVSIFSRVASTAGATEFDFDNFVMESRVYRRAFMGGFLRPRHISADTARYLESDTETIKAMDEVDIDQDELKTDEDANTEKEAQTNSASTPYFLCSGLLRIPPADRKRRRTLTVRSPNGGTLEIDAQSITEMIRFVEELHEKYRKVKKYYFDKDACLAKERGEHEIEVKFLLDSIDYARSIIDSLESTSCQETSAQGVTNETDLVPAELDGTPIFELVDCSPTEPHDILSTVLVAEPKTQLETMSTTWANQHLCRNDYDCNPVGLRSSAYKSINQDVPENSSDESSSSNSGSSAPVTPPTKHVGNLVKSSDAKELDQEIGFETSVWSIVSTI